MWKLLGWFAPLVLSAPTLLAAPGHSGRPAPPPPVPGVEGPAEAASRLRTLYFQWDHEEGRRLAGEYARRFPDSSEVAVWATYFPFSGARSGAKEQRLEEARRRVAEHPRDPWAWSNLAHALRFDGRRPGEARRAARKASSLAPGNPDFLWFRAGSLVDDGRYTEALDFIDRARRKVENPAELLVLRATVLDFLSQSGGAENAVYLEAALRNLAEARRIDPGNVNAHLQAGNLLLRARRAAEAVPLGQEAIRLAPGSTAAHRMYWTALTAGKDPGGRKAVEADIRELLRRRGEYPGTTYAVARQYGAMNLPDRRKEMEDRIFRNWPDSREVEFVLRDRWRSYAQEAGREALKDPRRQAVYRKMLRDFIRRPAHSGESTLAAAYMDLFVALRDDPSATDAEVIEAVEGLVRYDSVNTSATHVDAPIALADRGIRLERAEALVREGERKWREEQKAGIVWGSSRERREYQRGIEASLLDALGWVHFRQGRAAEAERELRRAGRMNPGRIETPYHLGRLFEAKGDVHRAEEFYGRGLAIEVLGENPSEKGLRDLYVRRFGGSEGFESYRERFRAEDREKRRKEILAARISTPAPAPEFDLKTLDGGRRRLSDLRGKIVVVNFWGLWCMWCLEEMPDVQKLHEKLAGDSGVMLLTVDNDSNVDAVRDWMKKKGFTFPVLLDDGYVDRVKIQAFPTTWFLDTQGRIAYNYAGWSRELVEDYLLMIESLRTPPG